MVASCHLVSSVHNARQRPDMALWPPSLINNDKSSLSAGAFKGSSTHCVITVKKLPRTEENRKHISFLAADKRDVEQTLSRILIKAMRHHRLLETFFSMKFPTRIVDSHISIKDHMLKRK